MFYRLTQSHLEPGISPASDIPLLLPSYGNAIPGSSFLGTKWFLITSEMLISWERSSAQIKERDRSIHQCPTLRLQETAFTFMTESQIEKNSNNKHFSKKFLSLQVRNSAKQQIWEKKKKFGVIKYWVGDTKRSNSKMSLNYSQDI